MHLDTEVAYALGLDYKSVRTKAKVLGLVKGEGYEEYFAKRQREINTVSHKGKTNSGQFKKGNKPTYTFPKGTPPQEMIEKRAATMRKQYREDKIRIKYGLEPKMKFKLKVKYDLNDYLNK